MQLQIVCYCNDVLIFASAIYSNPGIELLPWILTDVIIIMIIMVTVPFVAFCMFIMDFKACNYVDHLSA